MIKGKIKSGCDCYICGELICSNDWKKKDVDRVICGNCRINEIEHKKYKAHIERFACEAIKSVSQPEVRIVRLDSHLYAPTNTERSFFVTLAEIGVWPLSVLTTFLFTHVIIVMTS